MEHDLKVLDLQANVSLAQLVRHWTLKLVIISSIRSSPTGGNFFAVVISLEYNNAISADFVQTVKNSILTCKTFNHPTQANVNTCRLSCTPSGLCSTC